MHTLMSIWQNGKYNSERKNLAIEEKMRLTRD